MERREASLALVGAWHPWKWEIHKFQPSPTCNHLYILWGKVKIKDNSIFTAWHLFYMYFLTIPVLSKNTFYQNRHKVLISIIKIETHRYVFEFRHFDVHFWHTAAWWNCTFETESCEIWLIEYRTSRLKMCCNIQKSENHSSCCLKTV